MNFSESRTKSPSPRSTRSLTYWFITVALVAIGAHLALWLCCGVSPLWNRLEFYYDRFVERDASGNSLRVFSVETVIWSYATIIVGTIALCVAGFCWAGLTRMKLSLLMLALMVGCENKSKMPDSDTYPAAPRHPPAHVFERLPATPFETGVKEYSAIVPNLERYLDYGPDGVVDSKPWKDEAKFAKWLEEQGIPRDFADFLYQHAPERTLMINAGYLTGVRDIIEENSDPDCKHIRSAGFFILGSGPNGDYLVVDLENKGAAGFLPLEMVFSRTSKQLRELFIPLAPSIGRYLALSESSKDIPRDYWASKKWKENQKPTPSDQSGSK